MYNKFEQLAQRTDPQSRLIRTWELKGGVSAQVTALEVERPDGQTKKMVARWHGDRDLEQNPYIAADEFRLLRITQNLGLPTPAPYYLDESGTISPTPYLVVEYIEGETEFSPSSLPDLLLQLATLLSRIHKVDWSNVDLSFLPSQSARFEESIGTRPAILDESLDEERIRDALESVGPLPQQNESVLLHGDFWPGNILWRNGQIVGVVDWEDAGTGDPLADLANSRLEILWAFGIDAMDSLTHQYEGMTEFDFAALPIWDLVAALRPAHKIAEWAHDDITEMKWRERHRLFITQAFQKLSVQ